MAEFPAMPLWTDAYLADTMHLSDAEHGRYLKLLMHMWRAPGCRFPADRAWLERKTRRTPEQFDAEIQPLLSEFFQCDGNWWTQKKLKKVWEQVRDTSAKQSARAKCRTNKVPGTSRGSATKTLIESLTFLPSLEPVPSEPETHTVPSASEGTAGAGQAGTDLLGEQTGCDKPKRKRNDYPDAFVAFWAIYPKRSTDTKAGAFKAWDKARKAGTDLGALHEGALRYAAFVDRTGCETAHVQTWINREGWTASYASKGNGHANGATTNRRYSAIQDFHRRHAGPAGVGADTPDASDPPAGRG